MFTNYKIFLLDINLVCVVNRESVQWFWLIKMSAGEHNQNRQHHFYYDEAS